MKAIGLTQYLPIENKNSFQDFQCPKPEASDHDLLVKVHAVSVNPVDAKIRAPKDQVESSPRILGWDAAGEVVAVGQKVEHFMLGDLVYYAGDITRSGSNCEFQLVDERIVGRTAQGDDAGKSILIIGGAGGVGSIAIQLAKKLAKLKIIATASRPESQQWCMSRGADSVINHHQPLDGELAAMGVAHVDYILCLNNTDQHWSAMSKAIKPQGRICSIVDTSNVDLSLLKSKSATFVWEFMFTRPMYKTPDMIEQQQLLNKVADFIDEGVLSTTANILLQPVNAENLRKAHAIIEQGNSIGKLVLTDWV